MVLVQHYECDDRMRKHYNHEKPKAIEFPVSDCTVTRVLLQRDGIIRGQCCLDDTSSHARLTDREPPHEPEIASMIWSARHDKSSRSRATVFARALRVEDRAERLDLSGNQIGKKDRGRPRSRRTNNNPRSSLAVAMARAIRSRSWVDSRRERSKSVDNDDGRSVVVWLENRKMKK